jgi:acetoin utilization deacetylase AcuC-like enzyme
MRAFYSDQFVLPLPQGHRFPMGKYRVLRDRLAVEIPAIQTNVAQPATDGELALIHAPTYIQAVEQGTLGDKAQREIGFPWSPEMVARSRRLCLGTRALLPTWQVEPTMRMRTKEVDFVFSMTPRSLPA